MKKTCLSLVIVLMLLASFSACRATLEIPAEGLYVTSPEVIETRGVPELSEIEKDANFLSRRLSLDEYDYALGMAEMLYIYNIQNIKRAKLKRGEHGISVDDRVFEIVDANRDVYYVSFDKWCTVSGIWKIDENKKWVIVYMPVL